MTSADPRAAPQPADATRDEKAAEYRISMTGAIIEINPRPTAVHALGGRTALGVLPMAADVADAGLRFVGDLALGPTRCEVEMRRMMDRTGADVIAIFTGVCRREPAEIG